ncbi:hypothetical protein S40288_11246 [Stachybotrys chartarum IBT 40288]|nr:hypothetical protein S40288_11246 [Stachybotrys chartarum IBT 40288]
MGILGRIKQSGGIRHPAGQRGPSEEPVHSDPGDLIRVLWVKASTALRMFAVASLDDGNCEAVVSNSKFSRQASQVKTENREKGGKRMNGAWDTLQLVRLATRGLAAADEGSSVAASSTDSGGNAVARGTVLPVQPARGGDDKLHIVVRPASSTTSSQNSVLARHLRGPSARRGEHGFGLDPWLTRFQLCRFGV